MRIPCPLCGDRDLSEFAYLGDATLTRPDPSAPNAERAFTTTSISGTIRPARIAILASRLWLPVLAGRDA